jgi:tetratricopeptide (TPR) repeat protein
MIRHTKLMFAFLAMLALASTSCAKLQARDNLNKGVRAFREAKYEEAVNYFKQATKLDPGYLDAEVYLGMAYLQQFIPNAESEESQKNADLAIETFNGILSREPNNVSAIAGLAYMYQNLVQLQKAREYYKKNAELAPTDPVPLYAVGSVDWLIVFDKNNPPPEPEQLVLVDEGLSYLDKALAINPDYEEAMAYKNLLYREKARLTADEAAKAQLITQADEWFNKALETRKKIQEAKKSIGGMEAEVAQ